MIHKRTGQTQFKAILSTSHSGTHSCTARGHRTVHSQMFCPVTAHSPTAEVCMQQVVPNQLHIRALLSRKTLSHSSTNRHLYLLCTGKQNLCFLFPTRFVDLLFALYSLLPSLSIGLRLFSFFNKSRNNLLFSVFCGPTFCYYSSFRFSLPKSVLIFLLQCSVFSFSPQFLS